MPASIWLQLRGRQERHLERVIGALARAHGTVPFRPHLTVCSVADIAAFDAAAYAIGADLPIVAAKVAVTGAVITPFRAVFIEIEDTPQLHEFRERLRAICGAPELTPPHISLLYTLDRQTQQPRLDFDAERLAAIARDCTAQISEHRFTLARAVIKHSDGDWRNVRSWRVIRRL